PTSTCTPSLPDALPIAGGYEVLVSTQPGGPFQSFGRTSDKHASSITVSNLETDTTYYFRVRTISEPNENNKNEVISETGAEVSADRKSTRLNSSHVKIS